MEFIDDFSNFNPDDIIDVIDKKSKELRYILKIEAQSYDSSINAYTISYIFNKLSPSRKGGYTNWIFKPFDSRTPYIYKFNKYYKTPLYKVLYGL